MLDPGTDIIQALRPEPAMANAPSLFTGYQSGFLQDVNVLFDARQRYMEAFGQVSNRCALAPKMLQDAAPGRVRKRCKDAIQLR